MQTASYTSRRGELETYFDRTAVDAWAKLTTDAPVSKIRATVRAGRDEMRGTLLSWLPEDLSGCRLLDAGCGTGAFAVEAAARGADVTAVDLSPTLIDLANERAPKEFARGRITFLAGDMLNPELGRFDYIVGMDSLIHYNAKDMAEMLARLAARADRGVLFTHAPRTPLLTAMHMVGRLFPRSDRAPAIEPVSNKRLRGALTRHPRLEDWSIARTHQVTSGFYLSQAQELTAA